jgi:hypothetical protein
MAHVFVSAVGQSSNIGDSILRRAYIDALRGAGNIHVLVDGTTADYQSGLGLRTEDVVFSSRQAWWRASLASALRRRTLVAYNAGEMQLNRTFLLSYVKHWALTMVAKPRGGSGVHLGMGVRRQTKLGRLVGLTLRAASIVSWRDASSRSWTAVGQVNPDWGFHTGREIGLLRDDLSERPWMAVALRGDREYPGPDWFAVVGSVAERAGLRPIVVVQVERDDERARAISAAMGWDLLAWSGGSHVHHEKRVREVYAASNSVVSDRLHALVVGLTEGAVPIGYTPSSSEKIARTLDAAGLGDHIIDASSRVPDAKEQVFLLTQQRQSALGHLEDSRARLNRLTAQLRRLS